LERERQDGEAAQGRVLFEILTDGVGRTTAMSVEADELRNTDTDGETAHGAGRAHRGGGMPLMVGMRGSSQPVTTLVVHELDEACAWKQWCSWGSALAKFVLVRQMDRGRGRGFFENPVVERAVHFEFEGADAVGDAPQCSHSGNGRSSYIG